MEPDTILGEHEQVVIFFNDADRAVIKLEFGEAILKAWKGGETFFDAIGLYGQRVSIKLRNVDTIVLWTDEQLALLHEQLRLEKIKDKQEDLL